MKKPSRYTKPGAKATGGRSMSSVAGALDMALTALGRASLSRQAMIQATWPQIVGTGMAQVSWPIRLSQSELTVAVSEPAWIDSIGYVKRGVIDKINDLLGTEAVTSLKIILQKIPAPTKEDNRSPALDLDSVSPEARLKVAEALRLIPDSELRSDLERVMLKSAATEEWRKNSGK